MLRWAVNECDGPVAIRYPRGGEGSWSDPAFEFACDPDAFMYQPWGDDVTLITYGNISDEVVKAAQDLQNSDIHARVIRLYSVSNICGEKLAQCVSGDHVIIVEEACAGSGIKETVTWELSRCGIQARIHGLDLGHRFTPHGDIASLRKESRLDAESIVRYVREVRENEK